MVPSGRRRGGDDRARLHRAAARGRGGAAAGSPTSRRRCGGWRRSSPATPPRSDVFQAVTEEVCGLLGLRSALLLRYEDATTAHDRRQVRRRRTTTSSSATRSSSTEGAAAQPCWRTGAPARVDYERARRRARGPDAHARVPLERRRADQRRRIHVGGADRGLRETETLHGGDGAPAGGVRRAGRAGRRERAGARRARRLAAAHRRGGRRRAPPHRAQPARRRPAAARGALGRAAARPGEDRHAHRERPRSCSRSPPRTWPRRSRSCASWRRGSTPPCSPSAASRRRSRCWQRARRCRSRSTSICRIGCRPPSRRPRTTSSRSRSRTSSSTPAPAPRACASQRVDGHAARRGRRRRRRRRRPGRRLRPLRPPRPRRDARRPPRHRERGRPGHARPRRAARRMTITFFFSDIEDSTGLLTRLRDGYAPVLADAHGLVRTAVAAAAGREIECRGDELFCVFDHPEPAAAAARAALRAFRAHPWPAGESVRVRFGLHTGDADSAPGGGYVGIDVHRAARICQAAHGGQVLASQDAARLLRSPTRDLGEYDFSGLRDPERIHQLVADDLPADFPPLRNAREHTDALRAVIADDSTLLREGLARLLEEAGIDVVGQARDRRRADAEGAQLQPRRRDRRHPHAADPDRRGHPGRPRDPGQAPRHRRARALPARRPHLRGRAPGLQRRGPRLPAQGPRLRPRRVHRGGAPRRRGRLRARPARRLRARRAQPRTTTRWSSSPRASGRCSS